MAKKLTVFFSIGILIYILNNLFNSSTEDKLIIVFEEELDALKKSWISQVGRSPNKEEVEGIINQLVDEEMLYREALSLGLDKGDIIIKRRLAQKIGFLKQEMQIVEPSMEEINNFYLLNKDRYIIPRKFSFTHIYFNKDKDGSKRAIEAQRTIFNGLSGIDGDPFLLGRNFVMKTPMEIERSFGKDFYNSLKKQKIDIWVGPINSLYGSHLLKITDSISSKTPELEEVSELGIKDLKFQMKSNEMEDFLKILRTKYTVQVQSES